MKRVLSVILVLAMVLCFAACGKESKSGGSNIAGKYTFHSMKAGDKEITAKDLAAMGADIEQYIQLNSDGTGVMFSDGETMEMRYGNGKIWPVDEEDEKVSFSVKGNTLTMEQEGTTVIFKK